MNKMRSDTQTLIEALKILARDIQSGDGVANACIYEAAERLIELSVRISNTEILLFILGYQGGTIHQLCDELSLVQTAAERKKFNLPSNQAALLNASYDDMQDLMRMAQRAQRSRLNREFLEAHKVKPLTPKKGQKWKKL